ncbi:queuosine salvage family protein [Thermodesulfobacteriota bacterium]
MWEVTRTAKWVVSESQSVRIDDDALSRFARELHEKGVEAPPWDTAHHFHDGTERTVAYLLVLDTLNFCFWPREGATRWEVNYRGKWLSGYYALATALKRAMECGVPITRADFLRDLTLDGLRRILRGRGQLQLMERRCEALNELGRVLGERYGGSAAKFVDSAGNSAVRLVRRLAAEVTSFRDVAQYMGQDVFFYKRAQIFASDLHGALGGTRWGDFQDVGTLTAFADYKLPQVLRRLGILDYTDTLARKVDRRIPIRAGSPEEVELRANTVWAVELTRRDLARKGREVKAFEIDGLLWNLGQEDAFRTKPYHRTLTISY